MTNNKFLTLISLLSAVLFFSFPTQTQAIGISSLNTQLPKVVFTAARKAAPAPEPAFDINTHTASPDGSTTSIQIESLGVDAPLIYANSFDSQSSDWNCLKSYRACPMRYLLRYGILHIFGSPQPGDIGNSLLVGHSSCYEKGASAEKVGDRVTPYCKVLAKLPSLQSGSKITIKYSNGRVQTFEVFDNFRFWLANAKKISTQMDTQMSKINAKQRQVDTAKNAKTKATYQKQLDTLQAQYDQLNQKNEATNVNKRNAKFPNERVLTLETCFPLGTATDRWVVQARLLDDRIVTDTPQS